MKFTLSPGKTYEFRVTAVCNGQPGDYTDIIEYTTSNFTSSTAAGSRSNTGNDGESVFIKSNDLTIYPNPVVDNLTIQYQTENTGLLSLYHVSGAKVKSVPLQRDMSAYELNMSDLPDGFYLLKIEENGQLPLTRRVVKTAKR